MQQVARKKNFPRDRKSFTRGSVRYDFFFVPLVIHVFHVLLLHGEKHERKRRRRGKAKPATEGEAKRRKTLRKKSGFSSPSSSFAGNLVPITSIKLLTTIISTHIHAAKLTAGATPRPRAWRMILMIPRNAQAGAPTQPHREPPRFTRKLPSRPFFNDDGSEIREEGSEENIL